MIRKIHFIIGLALAGFYIYIITHLETVLPGLAVAMGSNAGTGPLRPGPGQGVFTVLKISLIPMVCFLFPGFLTRRLSPRTKVMGEPVLTEGFWLVIGHFFLLVSAALFVLFR